MRPLFPPRPTKTITQWTPPQFQDGRRTRSATGWSRTTSTRCMRRYQPSTANSSYRCANSSHERPSSSTGCLEMNSQLGFMAILSLTAALDKLPIWGIESYARWKSCQFEEWRVYCLHWTSCKHEEKLEFAWVNAYMLHVEVANLRSLAQVFMHRSSSWAANCYVIKASCIAVWWGHIYIKLIRGRCMLKNIYCIRHIFRESNFSRIGTSRHFREWLNSRSRRRAMDGGISIIHSFSELKANLASLPCTCTMYCTTSIAYTSRIHASGSEVNIFACC